MNLVFDYPLNWFILAAFLIIISIIFLDYVPIRIIRFKNYITNRIDSWITFQSTFKDTGHHLQSDNQTYKSWLSRNRWDGVAGVFRIGVSDKHYTDSDLLMIVSPKCTMLRCVIVPKEATDDNIFILDRRELKDLVLKLLEINEVLLKNEKQLKNLSHN